MTREILFKAKRLDNGEVLFPFKSKEIQVYDVVRVVCFKTEEGGQHEQ